MLQLKAATSPDWLQAALADVDRVLVDHAHCEHKAAVTALAFVSKYPDSSELCVRLSALAREEAEHFERMVRVCADRGLSLGHPDADPYVKALLAEARPQGLAHRVDRLLVCALIEARSCERLKLLAEHLDDDELRALYDELWRAEAGHHVLFVDLAVDSVLTAQPRKGRVAARAEVTARLEELLVAEAAIIEALPVRPAIH